MSSTSNDSSTIISPVRVNVSLCGSIPREDITCALKGSGIRGCGHTPLKSLTSSEMNSLSGKNLMLPRYEGLLSIVSQHPGMARIQHESQLQRQQQQLQQQHPSMPLYDPPTWAVPARGESRLEPVCEALGRQMSVDLTSRSYFRIGRSPNSDIQLMHGTSSRRHALLFHHSNGSCYVVDCGSAHGTFVNGVQISSPPRGGVVIPHKVRRGSMIRFGGPGAPCFVVKSFSSNVKTVSYDESELTHSKVSDSGDVVRLNTRINAFCNSSLVDTVSMSVLNMTCHKRSADLFESDSETSSMPCSKRMRCSSPPLSPSEPIRLVSPCSPSPKRRVTFSDDPPAMFFPALVTPDVLSSDEESYSD